MRPGTWGRWNVGTLGRRELAEAFRRWMLSVALLTDRRAVTLMIIDGLFLFFAVIVALMGDGTASGIYYSVFLIPSLLFAIPTLAETIALERRAGTLDLALSSPGARFYFERRVLSYGVLAFAQGLLAIAIAWLAVERFPLSGALIQTFIVTLFICSTTLFWCVRLHTAGSVIFATYATILCFSPWFFAVGYHPFSHHAGPMEPEEILDWFRRNIVLGMAAVIFYLYTVQRLNRPELILD